MRRAKFLNATPPHRSLALLGLALLLATPSIPTAHAADATRTDAPMAILDVYRAKDEDASELIGRFLPDEMALTAASEKSLRINECSKFFAVQNIPATLHREDVLSDKNGTHRRVEFDVSRRLSGKLTDLDGLKRCCQNNPGACTGKYVDSVLFGELFDRTEARGRQSIRETRGEKFFAFTVAPTPFHDESANRCDKNASWKTKVPQSEAGQYVVGMTHLTSNSGRTAALRDARTQAAEILFHQFKAQKAAVENAMGFVALSADDLRELKNLAKEMAANVVPECWDGPKSSDANTSVLALIPQTLLDQAMRTARSFFMGRTVQAVDSLLSQALNEVPKLLDGTGITSVHMDLPDDETAAAMKDDPDNRRALWLTERLVATWAKSAHPGLTATSALDEVHEAHVRQVDKDKAPKSVVIATSIQRGTTQGYLTLTVTLRRPDDTGRIQVIPLLKANLPRALFPDGSSSQSSPVKITFQTRPDGTVCPYSMVPLTLSTTRHLYVQLWALSGKNCDEAHLLHPASDTESGDVMPGEPMDLGPVLVVPTKGSRRECLLAIGATTKAALGEMGRFRDCKLGKSRTEKLLDLGKLLQAKDQLFIDRVEYVIADEKTCGEERQPISSEGKKRAQKEAKHTLERMPNCK